jgi:NitT/TauT family transport system substrate-binding protein
LVVPHLSSGLRGLVALLALSATLVPASAQQPVRIGIGFGLAFLPVYLCEDLKLIEKQGKAAHLDLKASYQRFFGAGPLHDAIGAGAIDMGPFGTAPLLVAWEQAKNTPRQFVAVSGITTLPLVLLTNQPNVRTIADFRPADRIAVPTSSSPQMYLLQMQSEKIFGQYDRLRDQIVILPHPDAVAGLLAATGLLAGYFSSAPYSQIALADGRVHKVLSSSDVIGGKASFLIMGASRGYVAAHPQIAGAVAAAMDEAAHVIRDDPRRAAEIYLAHEPSKTLDAAAVAAVLNDIKDEFGSAVHGVHAFADFMGRHGELKAPPRSWKEIVAPALVNSPST